MNPRSWLERYRWIVAGVAVAALVASAFFLVRRFTRDDARPQRAGQWFFDLASGEVSIQRPGVDAPLELSPGRKMPDGSPTGVKAYLFSCGDCRDAGSRFIAYLGKLPPEQRGLPPGRRSAAGEWVAEVDTSRYPWPLVWAPRDSQEGRRVLSVPATRCGGKPVAECYPDAPAAGNAGRAPGRG